MAYKTSLKISNRALASVLVKVKPDGTVILPKAWVKDISGIPVLATRINNILVITPEKARPDYSIDEKKLEKN